jgi:hypothetical protein
MGCRAEVVKAAITSAVLDTLAVNANVDYLVDGGRWRDLPIPCRSYAHFVICRGPHRWSAPL